MKKGRFQRKMGGENRRPSEKPMMRFGRPLRAKTPIARANESSSCESDSSCYRSGLSGPGLASAIIFGSIAGLYLGGFFG